MLTDFKYCGSTAFKCGPAWKKAPTWVSKFLPLESNLLCRPRKLELRVCRWSILHGCRKQKQRWKRSPSARRVTWVHNNCGLEQVKNNFPRRDRSSRPLKLERSSRRNWSNSHCKPRRTKRDRKGKISLLRPYLLRVWQHTSLVFTILMTMTMVG